MVTHRQVHRSSRFVSSVSVAAQTPGRTVDGSFVDFAWLPATRDTARPIVLLEVSCFPKIRGKTRSLHEIIVSHSVGQVDENQHSSAGWDAERYRELFVLESLQRDYPRCRHILVIRFNPHEYKVVDIQAANANQPNVFAIGDARDLRWAKERCV